jgi:hypothetical protein
MESKQYTVQWKKKGVGVVNLTVNWLKESGEKIGFGGAILG